MLQRAVDIETVHSEGPGCAHALAPCFPVPGKGSQEVEDALLVHLLQW